MLRRTIGLALAAVLLPLLLLRAAPPARIVAVADVHGASDAFASILRRAGLINEKLQWTGGTAVFVQTGDLMDRGPGVRAIFDMLMALEPQAQAAGGRVHLLMGNHEAMNLLGITRDTSPEAFASFADAQSEARRERAFDAAQKQRKDLDRTAWMAAHPPGYIEYRDALRPNARYGKWLRTHPVLVEIGGTVFMHGGLNPAFSDDTLDGIVRRAKRELADWDDAVQWMEGEKLTLPFSTFAEVVEAAQAELNRLEALRPQRDLTDDETARVKRVLTIVNIRASSLVHADGPLWFRGFATWSDADGPPQMAAVLQKYGVKRLVTGHTPQPGRITKRFDGALFLIDTGMLAGTFFPNGRASALELSGDVVNAIYEDGTVPLVEKAPVR